MVTLKVNISWCGKNYAAAIDEQVPGVVLVTHKTLEGIKKAVAEAVEFHKEGMMADGDEVPAWLIEGDYRYEWVMDTPAMSHSCFTLSPTQFHIY
ncbi:MAG: type II toxin-antitoxin system HicB family antitoxin [Prevotellaceae bacterium]|nr:type II toxin-antitoxin system HicB family antitoxin [Prevotellaceae bacterium]